MSPDSLQRNESALVVGLQGNDASTRLAQRMGLTKGVVLTARGYDEAARVYRFDSSIGQLELPLETCKRIVVEKR